jgi:hypothetical protein
MMALAPKRRDWFHILRQLKKAGVHYREVARKVSRDVNTVVNWAEGGEPKDSDAQVVLALFAKHCPIDYAEHIRQHGSIRERIEASTEQGESQVLPFVG